MKCLPQSLSSYFQTALSFGLQIYLQGWLDLSAYLSMHLCPPSPLVLSLWTSPDKCKNISIKILNGQQSPEILLSPPLKSWDGRNTAVPGFYAGAGNRSSGLRARMANTVSSGTSPQSLEK